MIIYYLTERLCTHVCDSHIVCSCWSSLFIEQNFLSRGTTCCHSQTLCVKSIGLCFCLVCYILFVSNLLLVLSSIHPSASHLPSAGSPDVCLRLTYQCICLSAGCLCAWQSVADSLQGEHRADGAAELLKHRSRLFTALHTVWVPAFLACHET